MVGRVAYVAVCWSDDRKKTKLVVSWSQKVPTKTMTSFLRAVLGIVCDRQPTFIKAEGWGPVVRLGEWVVKDDCVGDVILTDCNAV